MLAELIKRIPTDWREELAAAAADPAFGALDAAVCAAYAAGPVFPAPERVFAAFAHFPVAATKAVIVGQDPYHTPGAANGLAFGTNDPKRIPPSLRNVAKELRFDLGVELADFSLLSWAKQGVLLLNSSLTVPQGAPGGHARLGWGAFTASALRRLLAKKPQVLFVCWGAHARRTALAAGARNLLCCAHPSPLSAAGFLGSRPFSRANALLAKTGERPIV